MHIRRRVNSQLPFCRFFFFLKLNLKIYSPITIPHLGAGRIPYVMKIAFNGSDLIWAETSGPVFFFFLLFSEISGPVRSHGREIR